MEKKQQASLNETSHLRQDTDSEEFIMLCSHRQHQFHNDESQRIMDANSRQNKISLHVPPFFQDTQNHSD